MLPNGYCYESRALVPSPRHFDHAQCWRAQGKLGLKKLFRTMANLVEAIVLAYQWSCSCLMVSVYTQYYRL